jgi:hypothetical protein
LPKSALGSGPLSLAGAPLGSAPHLGTPTRDTSCPCSRAPVRWFLPQRRVPGRPRPPRGGAPAAPPAAPCDADGLASMSGVRDAPLCAAHTPSWNLHLLVDIITLAPLPGRQRGRLPHIKAAAPRAAGAVRHRRRGRRGGGADGAGARHPQLQSRRSPRQDLLGAPALHVPARLPLARHQRLRKYSGGISSPHVLIQLRTQPAASSRLSEVSVSPLQTALHRRTPRPPADAPDGAQPGRAPRQRRGAAPGPAARAAPQRAGPVRLQGDLIWHDLV